MWHKNWRLENLNNIKRVCIVRKGISATMLLKRKWSLLEKRFVGID